MENGKIKVVLYLDQNNGQEQKVLERYPLDIKESVCTKLDISMGPEQLPDGKKAIKELVKIATDNGKVEVNRILDISAPDELENELEALAEYLKL